MGLKEIIAGGIMFLTGCSQVFVYQNSQTKSCGVVDGSEAYYVDFENGQRIDTYINRYGGPQSIGIASKDLNGDGKIEEMAMAKADKTAVGPVYFYDFRREEFNVNKSKNWAGIVTEEAKTFWGANSGSFKALGIKNPFSK